MRYHAPFDGTRGSEPSRVAPCPRVTRRALTRRACWDSHHGRRSAVTTIGSLRSVHAVPQSARSSAPFDPGVGSILPFARLGCPNRRGTVPDSPMLVRNFASNLARSAACRPKHERFKSHARSKNGAYPGVPRRFGHPNLPNGPMAPTPRSNGADGGTLGLVGQISPPPQKWPDFDNNLSLGRSFYRAGAMQF